MEKTFPDKFWCSEHFNSVWHGHWKRNFWSSLSILLSLFLLLLLAIGKQHLFHHRLTTLHSLVHSFENRSPQICLPIIWKHCHYRTVPYFSVKSHRQSGHIYLLQFQAAVQSQRSGGSFYFFSKIVKVKYRPKVYPCHQPSNFHTVPYCADNLNTILLTTALLLNNALTYL